MAIGMMSIRRYAKRLLAPVIIVIVIAMMVGVFYIGVPNLGKENTSYVGPSIKVNGKQLKDSEFNNYLIQAAQQANQYVQYGMIYTEAQIRDTAISMALKDMAFEQELKKVESKLKVSGADVDALIKKYLPTEEELQSFIEKQGFTSKNELKKAVFKDIQRQKFIQYKARQLKITVPKSEILGMMEQITVSHILIGLKDANNKTRTNAAALQLANEVYQKATTGGEFAKLVKEYSDDPGSKDKNGTYGPMPVDQFKTSMVKEFVDGALALKNGQISKPVKTQYGYHIIKLDSRAMPKGNDYKEKYKETEDNLLIRKAQESPLFTEWLQKIYNKAKNKMEIVDPGLRAYRLKQEQKWNEAAQAYQKALKKSYYKNRVDTYIDASDVYLQLKQPKEAITVLKKAPVTTTDSIDYQIALANAYKANNQAALGKEILAKFGKSNASDVQVHTKLKQVYTEWNMNDLAAQEDQIITDIQKKEQENLKKYQEGLQQNASQ